MLFQSMTWVHIRIVLETKIKEIYIFNDMLKLLNSLIYIFPMLCWAVQSANQPTVFNINIFKPPVKAHALQSIK